MLGPSQPLLLFVRILPRSLLCYRGTQLICQSVTPQIRLCKNEVTVQNLTPMLFTGLYLLNTHLLVVMFYLFRMECSDMTARPQFSLVLTASISPTCTDESICWNICDDDATLGLQGSLSRVLCGLPGYVMVHLFDRGFL